MGKHRNHGLRKVCGCARAQWPKCSHSWYLNYKPKGGPPYRLSLDRELKQHIATKGEAEREANRIRVAIDAGTFRQVTPAAMPLAAADAPLTVEQLGTTYLRDYISEKTNAPLSSNERYRWELIMRTEIQRPNGAVVRFGDLPIASLTRHDLDAFKLVQREPRSVVCKDAKGRTYTATRGGTVSANRCLGRLRAFFTWAVDADYLPTSPFRKGDKNQVKMFGEAERERRLQPGEDARLLKAANPHLHALIVAALETGCRFGELLSLQWMHVRWDLNEIHLPGKNTKARRARHLPISQRLKAVLEMRRQDVDGHDFGPTSYVFGDDTGARVKSVKTAWENCRLRAHGIKPKRDKVTARLSAESRQKLAEIDLHFHDLRREAGSRFLEGGMAANYVQKFLDHANISTTSRYLKVERQGMHAALKTFEQGRKRKRVTVESVIGENRASASSEKRTARH